MKKKKTEMEAKDWETVQLKINKTKKEKKQLLFVMCMTYNLSDLNGPTRNMKVPAGIACKIIETRKPYHDAIDTGELHVYQR